MAVRDLFGVTVDILRNRDTFMICSDGKALTRPFAGFSHLDILNLEKSADRGFTTSIAISDNRAVVASEIAGPDSVISLP